jgi:hypothetical protein
MEAARSELAGGKLADNTPYALITVAAGERSARATIAQAKDALAILEALNEAPKEAPKRGAGRGRGTGRRPGYFPAGRRDVIIFRMSWYSGVDA